MIIKTKRISIYSLNLNNLESILNNKDYSFGDIDSSLTNPDKILVNDNYLLNLRINQLKMDKELTNWLLHIVVDNKSKQIVGNVGFHNRPDSRGVVEFGITIGSSYRKQGYAYEAIRALCLSAIDSGIVKIIRASVSPDNIASNNLIKKLGLKKIGQQIDEIDGLEYIFEIRADDFV